MKNKQKIKSIFGKFTGNDLARHLATCDRKTAYESAEVAQSNTVKCNMLDMLGLVRRDGEDEEDSSDGLLIPADQQQQLLSKSIDRENEKSQPAPAQNPSANGSAAAAAAAPNAMDDFNTQLSLDDLAPPQSVAPQPEQDRTPQLSDEYQVMCESHSNCVMKFINFFNLFRNFFLFYSHWQRHVSLIMLHNMKTMIMKWRQTTDLIGNRKK